MEGQLTESWGRPNIGKWTCQTDSDTFSMLWYILSVCSDTECRTWTHGRDLLQIRGTEWIEETKFFLISFLLARLVNLPCPFSY